MPPPPKPGHDGWRQWSSWSSWPNLQFECYGPIPTSASTFTRICLNKDIELPEGFVLQPLLDPLFSPNAMPHRSVRHERNPSSQGAPIQRTQDPHGWSICAVPPHDFITGVLCEEGVNLHNHTSVALSTRHRPCNLRVSHLYLIHCPKVLRTGPHQHSIVDQVPGVDKEASENHFHWSRQAGEGSTISRARITQGCPMRDDAISVTVRTCVGTLLLDGVHSLPHPEQRHFRLIYAHQRPLAWWRHGGIPSRWWRHAHRPFCCAAFLLRFGPVVQICKEIKQLQLAVRMSGECWTIFRPSATKSGRPYRVMYVSSSWGTHGGSALLGGGWSSITLSCDSDHVTVGALSLYADVLVADLKETRALTNVEAVHQNSALYWNPSSIRAV